MTIPTCGIDFAISIFKQLFLLEIFLLKIRHITGWRGFSVALQVTFGWKNKHLAIWWIYELFHSKYYNNRLTFTQKIAIFSNTSPIMTQLMVIKTITMKTKRLFMIYWKFRTTITLTVNPITLKMMTNKLKIKTAV